MNRVLLIVAMSLSTCALAAQIVVPTTSSKVSQLKQKAEAGVPAAQLQLARGYENGEGVPQTDEVALKW